MEDKYGSWTVLDKTPMGGISKRVRCRCACGVERDVLIGNLKSGKTTSCGCEKPKVVSAKMKRYWQKQAGGKG